MAMVTCARGHEHPAGTACPVCAIVDAMRPFALAQIAAMLRVDALLRNTPLTDDAALDAARALVQRASVEAPRFPPGEVAPTLVSSVEPAQRTRRPAADDLEGMQLGELHLERQLGSGGMGVVYAGTFRGQRVAIKVLHRATDRSWNQLRHEAAALRSLDGDEFVHIVDLVEVDGIRMLVMELVNGRPLRELMTNRWPTRNAIDLIARIANAVARAHTAGVMHTDLKPENILCEKHDNVLVPRVLDLGMAIVNQRDVDGGITNEGMIAGTPLYMAPEQTTGARLDERADVHALGSMLYELVAGVHPVNATGVVTDLTTIFERKRVLPPPPSTRAPQLSPMFDKVCMTALAPDRAHRFASADELAAALRSLSAH